MSGDFLIFRCQRGDIHRVAECFADVEEMIASAPFQSPVVNIDKRVNPGTAWWDVVKIYASV